MLELECDACDKTKYELQLFCVYLINIYHLHIYHTQVHIDAGKEDCYHQYVQAGATFYVSFSVSTHRRRR